MGTRGPKPLPANVHVMRGNPSKKPADQLKDAVSAPVAIPSCPDRNEYFRAEWDRITPHLAALGLVSELDRAMLTGYCTAVADIDWAEAMIAQLNANDPSGLAGRVMQTKTGYEQISVFMTIRNKALDQMRQFASEFGLSPSARARVNPVMPAGSKGDKQAEPGWDEFPGG